MTIKQLKEKQIKELNEKIEEIRQYGKIDMIFANLDLQNALERGIKSIQNELIEAVCDEILLTISPRKVENESDHLTCVEILSSIYDKIKEIKEYDNRKEM